MRQVGPDVTLGDEVRVEGGASVAASSLHDGVVVGEGAVVQDSIVGPNARIAAGARLEDETVIGEETAVPPGAHLVGGRLPADG